MSTPPTEAMMHSPHHRGQGRQDFDPVELYQLYTVDADGCRFAPHRDDPPTTWLAVVCPVGRLTRKVVWARPNMRSIGARFGAAGLLGNRLVMEQVARLYYDLERRDVPDDCAPFGLDQGLINERS